MVFYRISKFKYHIKCKKCELFSKKVEFLRHTISAASVGIVLAKVIAIKQCSQPICFKDIHVFLGLAYYYQHFVCIDCLTIKKMSL